MKEQNGGTNDVAGCKKKKTEKKEEKKNGGGSCRSVVKKAFRNRKGEILRVRGQGGDVGKPSGG